MTSPLQHELPSLQTVTQLRIEVDELLRSQHLGRWLWPETRASDYAYVYGVFAAVRILSELRERTQGRQVVLTLVVLVNKYTAELLGVVETVAKMFSLRLNQYVLCVLPQNHADASLAQQHVPVELLDRMSYWYWDRPVSLPVQSLRDSFCLAVTLNGDSEPDWEFRYVLTVPRRG